MVIKYDWRIVSNLEISRVTYYNISSAFSSCRILLLRKNIFYESAYLFDKKNVFVKYKIFMLNNKNSCFVEKSKFLVQFLQSKYFFSSLLLPLSFSETAILIRNFFLTKKATTNFFCLSTFKLNYPN